MKRLIDYIRNKIKAVYRINYLYPKKFPFSKFYSLVPKIILNSKGSLIRENVIIENWNRIEEFGNNIFIGRNTLIDNCSVIGSYTSISFDVKIGLVNHRLDLISTSPYFYDKKKGWVGEMKNKIIDPVIIGPDVLISSNCVILEGISLGIGCVIGSGSVVTKDVPPYAIVGGVPAKIIKYRFSDDNIEKLVNSKWWDEDPEKLKKLSDNFNNVDSFLKHLY